MDVLKAEIERKKRQLESKDLIGKDRKVFKRSDLVAKFDEEYWAKENAKKKTMTDTTKPDVGSNDANSGPSVEIVKNTFQLPRKEVVRRLRERAEPVLLFGETELESFKRLQRLEIMQPEVSRGFRNDFQEAMEKVDEDYMNEILKNENQGGSSSDRPSTSGFDVKVIEEKITIDEIVEMSENLGKGNVEADCKVVLAFLQNIVQLWGQKLNNRPAEEKGSFKGRLASARFSQTQEYLRPLIRKLKTKSLQEDLMESLVEITQLLIIREYIQANKVYLQMAIGNAPWPIGVTMVGIHARTGREKIHSKNVAHVLNDEAQRKYIQGLKRLMTKCQKYFPTDPSKCVEYSGVADDDV